MRTTELAIVGAGPAGLAAAAEASRRGVAVTLLDDNPLPGGQYFRQGAATRGAGGKSAREAARAAALFAVTSEPRVTYLANAVVWGAPDDRTLAFASGDVADRLRAEVVMVAAGASDRAVPFPGWTLPGVVTAGGAQNLVKSQGVLPGLRAVVAGNGPLLFVVADSLRHAGAAVVEVLEVAPLGAAWRALPGLAAVPSLLWRGVRYRLGLLAAGVPVRPGHTVIEARGEEEVREVLVAPIDRMGRPDRTRTRAIAADTLVVGFGLTPSVELTRLLGCEHRWDPLRGGWLPVRSVDLETTVPGVFTAGDGAGIGGVETALVEGRLAGLLASVRLGRCAAAEAAVAARALRARLARLARFRAALERLYTPPPDLLSLVTPETIVCRCEDVTGDEIVERVRDGHRSLDAVKAATRVTMGRCQGRNCLRTVADLVARETGTLVERLAWPRARPPARPVRVGALLSEPLPPARPPEMTLP